MVGFPALAGFPESALGSVEFLALSPAASALGWQESLEWGPQLRPSLLRRQPPRLSTGPLPGLVLAFLGLELVLVCLASEQVQCRDPWLQLRQRNTEREACLELSVCPGASACPGVSACPGGWAE